MRPAAHSEDLIPIFDLVFIVVHVFLVRLCGKEGLKNLEWLCACAPTLKRAWVRLGSRLKALSFHREMHKTSVGRDSLWGPKRFLRPRLTLRTQLNGVQLSKKPSALLKTRGESNTSLAPSILQSCCWIRIEFSSDKGYNPSFIPALLRNIKGLISWTYGDGLEPDWSGQDADT